MWVCVSSKTRFVLEWERIDEKFHARHSGMVRGRQNRRRFCAEHQTRNLEILRCAIAHHSSLVALAPRNDQAHTFAFPRRNSARVIPKLRPSEGAGNAGRSMRPQPRVRK